MNDIKNPPSNIEAERAVLGSILLDTTSRNGDRVMDLCLTSRLTPESFFDPRNRAIYATMMEMNRASRPLDPLTLVDELSATLILQDYLDRRKNCSSYKNGAE